MIERIFLNNNEAVTYPFITDIEAYPQDIITDIRITTSEDTTGIYVTYIDISETQAAVILRALHSTNTVYDESLSGSSSESSESSESMVVSTDGIRFSDYFSTWDKTGPAISTIYGKTATEETAVGWVMWGSGVSRSGSFAGNAQISPTCIHSYNYIQGKIYTSKASYKMSTCVNIETGSNITSTGASLYIDTSNLGGLDVRSVYSDGSIYQINEEKVSATCTATLNLPTYTAGDGTRYNLLRATSQIFNDTKTTVITIYTNDDIIDKIRQDYGVDPLKNYTCETDDSILRNIKHSTNNEDATKELPLDTFLEWYGQQDSSSED